jgi:hypothetical protein
MLGAMHHTLFARPHNMKELCKFVWCCLVVILLFYDGTDITWVWQQDCVIRLLH